ncbi:MAG: lipopolysaccharide biosynthesis protein [Blastocatellia bacterium]
MKAETEISTEIPADPDPAARPRAGEAPAPARRPRLRFGETTRQAGMLFSAQTGSMLAGFVISLIQARWMEPAEMGRFAFCVAVVVITSIFFEFGVFSAGARVLALERDGAAQRRALGALVLMTAAISLAFSLFIAAIAVPVELFFNKDVRWLLLAAAALAFFQPFQFFVEQVCQGLNRIRLLSLFNLLLSGLYLLILAGAALAHRLTAGVALGAYLGGIALAAVWAIARLRPSFRGMSPYVRLTISEARGYGLNLYLARITGVISSRSDQLVIAYFLTGAAPLGIYAIVQKFGNPIAMMGRSLAVTRFRAFASLPRIPRRIIRWNVWLLVASSAALVAVGPLAIKMAFPKYVEGAPLLLPFALTNLFVGLYQPYNCFLAAHGRGAEIRNVVFAVTVASVGGLVLSVSRFGIMGAAWTGAAAMALDYVLHLYYYQRFRSGLEKAAAGPGGRSSRATV